MIRQLGNTTRHITFLMIDSTDGKTGKTGLTPTVTLIKNSATAVAAVGAVTEISSGLYKLAANASDFDTMGQMVLHIEAAGAVTRDMEVNVVAFDPYNAINLGLTDLDAAVSTRSSHSAADAAAAVLSSTSIEGTLSMVDAMRLLLAAMAGKVSGAGTSTITFRNYGDTMNMIVATVDADGNRSDLTYQLA